MTLSEPNIFGKLSQISQDCADVLNGHRLEVPDFPARDIEVLPIHSHPPKKGLSYVEGQARLLHDLANIELQAMELALRTLADFPTANPEFREELASICLSESVHLQLCLDQIAELGFSWGSWPAHTALWEATDRKDSLIDRILIVHRYLEGSGLDAGQTILMKLIGVPDNRIRKAVEKIVTEEVAHVEFGSRWYKQLCREMDLDPETDFKIRLERLKKQLPRRLENMSWTLRKEAGFSEGELVALTEFQDQQRKLVNKNKGS